MGTGIDPGPQTIKSVTSFWRSFWGQFGSENLMISLMFFERVLFATLGAIGEGMGGNMVPKESKKVSETDHFEVRVDF